MQLKLPKSYFGCFWSSVTFQRNMINDSQTSQKKAYIFYFIKNGFNILTFLFRIFYFNFCESARYAARRHIVVPALARLKSHRPCYIKARAELLRAFFAWSIADCGTTLFFSERVSLHVIKNIY